MESENKKIKKNIFRNMNWKQQIVAGWPLILILAGGAIGGACGGAAYWISAKIFNSNKSDGIKYLLSGLTGLGSIVGCIAIVGILTLIFPGLFVNDAFKTSYRNNFIDSCSKQTSTQEQRMLCECVADDILENVAPKQLVDMGYIRQYVESTALGACAEKLSKTSNP